jgi:hypothetical protein
MMTHASKFIAIADEELLRFFVQYTAHSHSQPIHIRDSGSLAGLSHDVT